jgi:hypothetical protein
VFQTLNVQIRISYAERERERKRGKCHRDKTRVFLKISSKIRNTFFSNQMSLKSDM